MVLRIKKIVIFAQETKAGKMAARFSLAGKRIVVTGGTKGIGKACVDGGSYFGLRL